MEKFNFIDKIGDIVRIIWIILLSVFAPVAASIYVLSIFFIINVFMGYHADRIINRKDFSLDKIGKGVMLFILYFVLIFVMNISFSLYHEEELSVTVPKFFTWLASYFYLINIIRNAKHIFPKNEGLTFFYQVLTIQVLDMLLAKIGIKKRDSDYGEKDKE